MISSWCLAVRIWQDYKGSLTERNGRAICDSRFLEAKASQMVMEVFRSRTESFDEYPTSTLRGE